MRSAVGLVRQECGVGIVDIDVSGTSFAFVAPPTKIKPLTETQLQAIVKALEISLDSIKHTALLENGPEWQVLELETAAQVLALDSSRVKWPEFKSIGLIGAHPPGSECDFEVRMLAPSSGMSEDPITGQLNAALAHWLCAQGRLNSTITVAQGTKINRHGRVSIRPDVDADKIFIGGDTHIIFDGHITL
jgi:PhzF family phenazine biosynthesis protein